MRHVSNYGDLLEVDAFAGVVGASEEEHARAVEIELRASCLCLIPKFFSVQGLKIVFGSWPSYQECVVGDACGNDVALKDVPTLDVSSLISLLLRDLPSSLDLDGVLGGHPGSSKFVHPCTLS